MNIFSQLNEDDIRLFTPFENKKVVGRIYKKGQLFVGEISGISVPNVCILRMEPIVKLTPHLENKNPMDHNSALIEDGDKVIAGTFSVKARPFTLNEPEKVTQDDLQDQNTLVIKFTDGNVILSTRPDDTKSVEDFLALQ